MPETKFVGRQELSEEQRMQAQRDGLKLTNNRSFTQLRAICVALCQENMRLVLEVNAARAAAGLEPLPVYEVK